MLKLKIVSNLWDVAIGKKWKGKNGIVDGNVLMWTRSAISRNITDFTHYANTNEIELLGCNY